MAAIRFRELMMVAGSAFALMTSVGVAQPVRLTTPQGNNLYVVAVSSDGVALLRPVDQADDRVFRFTPGVGFGPNAGAGLQEVSVGGLSNFRHALWSAKLSKGGREVALAINLPPFFEEHFRGYRATITPVNLPPLQQVPPVPAVVLPGGDRFIAPMISDDGKTVVAQRYNASTSSENLDDIVSISPQGAVTVLATKPANGYVELRDISNDGKTVLWNKVLNRQVAECQHGAGYGGVVQPPSIFTVDDYTVEVARDGAVQLVEGTALPGQADLIASVLSGDGRYAFVTGYAFVENTGICNDEFAGLEALTGIRPSRVDLSTGETYPLQFSADAHFNVTHTTYDGEVSVGWREAIHPLYPNGAPPAQLWAEHAVFPQQEITTWWGLTSAAPGSFFAGLWSAYSVGFPPTSPAYLSHSFPVFGRGNLESTYFYLSIDPTTGEPVTDPQLYALVLDSDGDGLLDNWEAPVEQGGGIDSDGDGVADLDLYAGARNGRKDLFLEIDAASGYMPTDHAVQMVVAAFAAGPVTNLDGTTGVTLHIERGESTLPLTVIASDGGFPDLFPEHKRDHFGTLDERGANWNKVRNAKLRAYRYMTVYQSVLTTELDPVSYGGIAEDNGNDAVIVGGGSDEESAALIMHEFGHNLGLGHGGADNINYKPNHLSIMNYLLAYRSAFSRKFWRLDFSRAGCETINESAVNEARGIRVDPEDPDRGIYRFFRMPYKAGPAALAPVRTTRTNGHATDFNANGHINSSTPIDLNWFGTSNAVPGSGTPLGSVQSPSQVLESVDEWAMLKYPINNFTLLLEGPSANSVPIMQNVTTGEESPDVIKAYLADRITEPCYADIGSQGGVSGPDGLLDNNDFVVFISAFFEQDFETADMGMQGGLFGADDLLDNNDFISFINEFFAAGCN